MVEKDEDGKEKVLELTIEELDLSVRSFNCLKRAGDVYKRQDLFPLNLLSMLQRYSLFAPSAARLPV